MSFILPTTESKYKKMYVYVFYTLYMNPITSCIDDVNYIKQFHSIEEAKSFYQNEKVDPYFLDGYIKNFRQGGPLEWYNPFREEYWNVPHGYGLRKDF